MAKRVIKRPLIDKDIAQRKKIIMPEIRKRRSLHALSLQMP